MAWNRFAGLTLALALVASLLTFGGCAKGELVIYGSDAEGDEAGDALPSKLDLAFSKMVADPFNPPSTWQPQLSRKLGPNYYVGMATWQAAGVDRVSVGLLYDNVGGGTMHELLWNGQRVETPPDPNPVRVITLTANMTYDHYYIAFGWVLDPSVASFSLKLSDGRETKMTAATHGYFLAVLGRVTPPQAAVTVAQVTAWDSVGNTLAQWVPGS